MPTAQAAVPPRTPGPTRPTGHPPPDVLRDFMAGRLSTEAAKRVVVHLLAGCRSCAEETRRIWDFAEEPLDSRYPPYGEGGEP